MVVRRAGYTVGKMLDCWMEDGILTRVGLRAALMVVKTDQRTAVRKVVDSVN